LHYAASCWLQLAYFPETFEECVSVKGAELILVLGDNIQLRAAV
jgi:hypothetical protein